MPVAKEQKPINTVLDFNMILQEGFIFQKINLDVNIINKKFQFLTSSILPQKLTLL